MRKLRAQEQSDGSGSPGGFLPSPFTYTLHVGSVAGPGRGASRGQNHPVRGVLAVSLAIRRSWSCSEPQHGNPRGWEAQSEALGGDSSGEFSVGAVEGGSSRQGLGPFQASCLAFLPELLPGGFKTMLSSCFKFPGRGLQRRGVCRPSGVWAAIYQGPLWDEALQAGGSHNCLQLGCQPAGGVGGRLGMVGRGEARAREEARGLQGPIQPP